MPRREPDAAARRPYRNAADTPLEVMLRSSLPPIGRSFPVRVVGFGIGVTASSLVLFGLEMTAGTLLVLGLGWGALWCARRSGEVYLRQGESLSGLRTRLANYAIPVVGHMAHWIEGNQLHLGRIDLVLRAPNPLVEPTVRLAEPDAQLTWTTPTRLRVGVTWYGDDSDLPRLDRLVVLLGVYREELGLEHIELVPRYEVLAG